MAKKSLQKQLILGAAGAVLLTAAGFAYEKYYALSFFLVALSLFPLRGCPVCWLVDTCEIARNAPKKPLDDKAAN